jgi:hypothetical protein
MDWLACCCRKWQFFVGDLNASAMVAVDDIAGACMGMGAGDSASLAPTGCFIGFV